MLAEAASFITLLPPNEVRDSEGEAVALPRSVHGNATLIDTNFMNWVDYEDAQHLASAFSN
jgi:hypothetical protein